MKQRAYFMDRQRRSVVLSAVREVCSHRGWSLLAAHVRPTHFHVVVRADESPEPVMNALKSYASRALNRAALDTADRKRWARHGSTRYIWKPEEVGRAIHYVVREQGESMAVWESRNAMG